jgi:hypothetical protein
MNSPLQALAVVDDFNGLVLAMKARRHALRISQNELDDLTGLPDGYIGKVELSATNPRAKNARSLGQLSMPEILRALNLKLVLVDDGAADHLRRLPAPKAPPSPLLIAPPPTPTGDARSRLIDRCRKAGKARWAHKTPEERSAATRRAALIRWERHRKMLEAPPLKRTKPKTKGN